MAEWYIASQPNHTSGVNAIMGSCVAMRQLLAADSTGWKRGMRAPMS
jgi:hypothetical protein